MNEWLLIVMFFAPLDPNTLINFPYYQYQLTMPSAETCRRAAHDAEKIVDNPSITVIASCFSPSDVRALRMDQNR